MLKLYREGWPRRVAEYEYGKALASQQTGYKVPLVGEIIEIDGRTGITYQRVEGETMLAAMRKQARKTSAYTRQWARLHIDMHTRRAENLPTIHQRLAEKIEHAPGLDDSAKYKILTHLASLPQDDKLLHGDFHPDNILLTPQGSVIIDWIDANRGHPLADVARTTLLSLVAVPRQEKAMRLLVRFMRRIYLGEYFRRSPFARKDLDAWMLPVAAGRLEENIPHEREDLLKMVARGLEKFG